MNAYRVALIASGTKQSEMPGNPGRRDCFAAWRLAMIESLGPALLFPEPAAWWRANARSSLK
jgi:hypothetical protein